ncbi:MAG: choice-of-anchor Q domain-containing protein [Verrucomicrobiota bacterium]
MGDGGPGGDSTHGQGGSGGDSGLAGVALARTDFSSFTFQNCTFVNNSIGIPGAGGSGTSPGGDGSPGIGSALSLLHDPSNTLRIVHCTITDNSGGTGGAIFSVGTSPANVIIENTIIANNSDATTPVDFSGTATGAGVNVIPNLSPSATTLSGGSRITSPPLLAPLADYCGPTDSRFPYPSSPAVNAAAAGIVTEDQRGHPRPIGSAPDIGAVESDVGLVITDSDADGMDDFWEQLFGLVVGTNDANLDKDGDGSTNLEEFGNHTNPCDATSVLQVLSFQHIGFGPPPNSYPIFDVTWSSWPGLSYTSRFGTDLSTWNINANHTGTPASPTTTIPITLPPRNHFTEIRRN